MFAPQHGESVGRKILLKVVKKAARYDFLFCRKKSLFANRQRMQPLQKTIKTAESRGKLNPFNHG